MNLGSWNFCYVLLSCLFITFSGPSCIREKIGSGTDIIHIGDSLPDFQLVMDDGAVLSRSDLHGKISVMVFFNTSCSDCRFVLPEIQELYDNYSAVHNVEIFTVSREQDFNSVYSYWKDNNYNVPFSAQEGRGIYELFALSGIPRIYLSDGGLVVRGMFSDSNMPSANDISEVIETLRFP